MKNISNAFKEELNNGNRNFVKSCTITLADGTVLNVTQKDTWQNGFSIDEAVSSENTFDLGSAIIDEFDLTLNNIYEDFSAYDFTDAVITNVRIGLVLPNGTTEYVKRGVFTVDEARYNGSTITLECLDNMTKFDKDYSLSNLSYPTTLLNIVRDACSCCNVTMASDIASFPNSSFTVNTRPISDGLTFRKVLTWVAQISGIWFKCNENGQLSSKSLDMALVDSLSGNIDGGTFSPWTTGDVLDGGTFNPWNTGDVVDGGSFSDMSKYHHIFSIINPDIATDDVVVTGVQVKEQVDDEVKTYLNGTTGYVLSIEENGLIQDGKGSTVASYLGNKFVGLRFRPLTVSCLTDPSIEAGDLAYVTDRHNRSYFTIITRQTLTPGKFQEIACNAETPKKNSSSRYSQSTQIYQEFRKNLEKQKTEFEKSIESLNSLIENSPGAYMTKIQTESGGTITYLHNHPTIEESDMIWEMTAEGWRVSDNGGATWVAGMKVNGEVIAQILTAIGVNADWINSGAIVVKDSDGNVKFSVDIDTDAVFVNGSVIQIGNKPLETALADVLQEANQYSDDSFTQETVLNALTNNGQAKGIYLQDGQLYISFTYAKGGYLDLGGSNNEKGLFRIFNSAGTLVGIIENGQLKLSANINNANNPEVSLWEQGLQVDINGTVYAGLQFLPISGSSGTTITPVLTGYDSFRIDSKKAVGSTIYPYSFIRGSVKSDGSSIVEFPTDVKCYKSLQVNTMEANTNAANVYWNPYDTYFYRSTSSSERYKDINRVLTDEDVENLYDIEVYLAKYKDDYLSEADERYQKYMPMFTVENMEQYLPIAVNHNPDGIPEMWNSQIMIPVMFQMLKSQKSTIDTLTERFNKLENLLSTKGVI